MRVRSSAIAIGLVSVVGLIFILGCGVSDNDNESGSDQLAQFGGFTPVDEAPGFGDPGLVASHPEDTPYQDAIENSYDVKQGKGDRRSKFYMLRLVWGNLSGPDTVTTCPETDWSGSLTADGGVIIIRRLIRFEPTDSIVRPRHGSKEVDWISTTSGDIDGILFEIIDVPDARSKTFTNSVTITTPLFSGEIPFADLADYDSTVTIDACNGISIVATQFKQPGACPRGFLEGAWVAESDTSGTFEGAWIRDDGSLDGFLHGRYGVQDNVRVLFGKWITTDGTFGGLMKGVWGPGADDDSDDADLDENPEPDGEFHGHWVDDAFMVVGTFRGVYSLPVAGDSLGSFHGSWRRDCK